MNALATKSIKRLAIATTLVTCVSPSLLFAGPEKKVIRDAPTNEDLVLQIRKAQAESSIRPAPQTVVSQDASKMSTSDNLLDSCIVLSYRGSATLVPKGAVIEFSDKYKDRMQRAPGDQLVEFLTFVTQNRGWLSTHEVSFVQAQGKAPLDKDAKAQMKKSGNMVVATFRGNPIQVMPPVLPTEVASENQSQSTNPQR